MRYKAKVDWWIGASLLIGLCMPVIVAVVTGQAWLFAVAAAIWALVFGFCYPQSYELGSDALMVRAGLSKRAIRYTEISTVAHSTEWGSALALSLDRVHLVAAGTELLIAPRNKEMFLQDILAKAPQLTWVGLDLSARLG